MRLTAIRPSESIEAERAWLIYSGLRYRDPEIKETKEESLQHQAFLAGVEWMDKIAKQPDEETKP